MPAHLGFEALGPHSARDMFTRRKQNVTGNCTYPGIPPDSMWFAMITSLDQTSKCHFLLPSTPHITEPLWMPMRMLRSTCKINKRKIHKICKARARCNCDTHSKCCILSRAPSLLTACLLLHDTVSMCLSVSLSSSVSACLLWPTVTN